MPTLQPGPSPEEIEHGRIADIYKINSKPIFWDNYVQVSTWLMVFRCFKTWEAKGQTSGIATSWIKFTGWTPISIRWSYNILRKLFGIFKDGPLFQGKTPGLHRHLLPSNGLKRSAVWVNPTALAWHQICWGRNRIPNKNEKKSSGWWF